MISGTASGIGAATVMFSVVAWYADHNRPLWLPLFIAATLLSVVTALLVLLGFLRHVRPAPHGATTTRATATASATHSSTLHG